MTDRGLGRLSGKIVIVTGAGGVRGGVSIGKAIALLFAQEGARVAIIDRDLEKAELTRLEIEENGGEAIAIMGDVSADDDCRAATARVATVFGRIDVLVNNVGIVKRGALEAFDEEAWSHTINVNLKGALLMFRHSMPHMMSAGGGATVNIASIVALVSNGGGLFAYGPSKAALLALTRDIAVRYGKDGIRANAIVPGYLYSPMVNQLSGGALDEDVRERRRKVSPLGIEGDGWDIVRAALFLASDEARYITGVCLPVDGGASIVSPLTAVEMVTG
ncbi:MAG: SDR family NAD(P)-dependent oxidoreductase [Phenylobacterium sp.]|uniref:SDR family NAD(P)-dependent oxidoreductase n=1 Tax=Phenylobacterium sp. TaxID=1871053 RepID=UPI002737731C|nr:SDR family NAD(P)-dependent oxidoreductase [Phenylobacterium sp.]MDP3175873.1 SDR family NAD(P)-dependent oxidoreductase [Phenylobacterium sp.]